PFTYRVVRNYLNSIVPAQNQRGVIDFLDFQHLANLPGDYDLITPEELASIYEIGFAHASMQSASLQRRLAEARAGAIADSSAEKIWGLFATTAGEFVHIGD